MASISSIPHDIPFFPTKFSASKNSKNIKLKFSEEKLHAKIYTGKNKQNVAIVRHWSTLFLIKHVKINVQINNISHPILIRKSALQKKLGVSNENLDSLLNFTAANEGTLNQLVRINEIAKTKFHSNIDDFQIFKNNAAEELERGETKVYSEPYISHKTENGKVKVYKNFKTVLGEGSFKKVNLYAKISETGIKLMAYAEVKRHPVRHLDYIKDAQYEYTLGRKLYSEFMEEHSGEINPFLKYRLAVNETDPGNRSFGILMEYCEMSAKEAKLGSRLAEPVGVNDNSQKAQIFLDILKGISFMHSQGYVHRDLKFSNILLKKVEIASDGEVMERYVPKIIDFGLSDKVKNITSLKHFGGTYDYSPPEAFAPHQFKGDATKLDSWALGVMLYEMHVGLKPTFSNQISDYQKIKKKNGNIDDAAEKVVQHMQDVCDSFLVDPDLAVLPIHHTIIHLLKMNPDERWSPQQALDYLSDIKDLKIGLLV